MTFKGAALETSTVRVLVVEDYEPFRRFVCSTLRKSLDLQIVGEASDGLEAVQKAEELKPDLIVLDIGLPSLNGIEAARRIRKAAPQSKIIFVSQESSADVVQEALALGALGYVVKAHAGVRGHGELTLRTKLDTAVQAEMYAALVGYCAIELPTAENILVELDPMIRTMPTTSRTTTANMMAYSATS